MKYHIPEIDRTDGTMQRKKARRKERLKSRSTSAENSVWLHSVWLINSEPVQRSESGAGVCHNNNDPKKQRGIITSITPRLFLSNQGHPDVEFHLISLSSFAPAQLLAVTAGERFQNPGRSEGSGSCSFLRGRASGGQSAASIGTGRWDGEQGALQRWGRLTTAPAYWNDIKIKKIILFFSSLLKTI